MKPCPFCYAAVHDDIPYTPGEMFCGACGRNAAQVQQAPTLPPGAMPFAPPAPQSAPTGYAGAPPPVGQGGVAPQGVTPSGAPPYGGPQIGTPYGAPQGGPAPGPQIGSPQGGWPPPAQTPGYPAGGAPWTAAPPGLNWGAFLLPFVWGPVHKVYIGLLSLVSFLPLLGINLGGLSSFTGLASFGVSIYLLIKGNELAWRAGRNGVAWQSVQEFQAEQKKWVTYGLVALAVEVVLVMINSAALLSGGVPATPTPTTTPGF